jgi:hypothetical protein
VFLNQSFDEVVDASSTLFHQDDNRVLKLLSRDAVIECLVRDKCCPEWIDILACAIAPDFTVMKLLCCGRFTADASRLYYQSAGMGPFGIKSPDLPRSFQDGKLFPLPTIS